ncbi:MAG: DUF349 domain-containing protein [Bacteroidales bacterium]|nr:DUF349 domain-containing protein [Candidatus Liminaster caballi]
MAEVIETEKKIYANRQEIIDRLAEIVNETSDEAKGEITYLKMLYYKLRQQEVDAELKALLEGDGDAASYESKPDELEPRLRELLNIQKEVRAAVVEARNKEMAENLEKKQSILKEMIAIAQDAEGVGQQYNRFVELQKEFKEVGTVDAQEVNTLWKQYNMLCEQFYDALKINKELRDYDFKKNLDRKTEICEETEKLGEAEDIIPAFRRLQELHEEWKGLGPVAPALREEIWARFKAASTVINKRHQDHFEAIKAVETANEQGKTEICERIEAIDLNAITSVKDWEAQTAAVLAAQEEWRKLGFANRKVNNQLFERFRQACDAFFKAKADFFRSIRDEQNANLEKKVALCEKAEALKDSTEWRKTSDLLVNMQKEWKTIGPVPRKMSNQVWERFRGACDVFFAAKEKAVGGERAEETANLEKKQSVIDRLKALADDLASAEPQQVRDLMAEWNAVGHVPFKEKDKLYAAYKELVDLFFDKLDMKGQKARLNNYKERVKTMASEGKQKVETERQRLQRQLERLQTDLKTYENNLGFLSAKSKGGNGMVALMERKKHELQTEIEEIIAKINLCE